MLKFILIFTLTTTHFGIQKTEKWRLPYPLKTITECNELVKEFHRLSPKETFTTECKLAN